MTVDRQTFLQDLQNRLAELARKGPAADLERNIKAVLAQAFQRLELVTRDEFDAHVDMLAALRQRVTQLEETIATLERSAGQTPPPG
jgi:hypothetical protein